MQLAKQLLETVSKNYGTNSPNSQETTIARNPNAIYKLLGGVVFIQKLDFLSPYFRVKF